MAGNRLRTRGRVAGLRGPNVMGSVRLRTTLAAVVVVGVALIGGGVALVMTMRNTLEREVGIAARLRAADVAAVLETGATPASLAVSRDDLLIQVLDRNGTVVASSPNVAGHPAVGRLAPGQTTEVDVPLDDDKFLAVATAARTDYGVPATQAGYGVPATQAGHGVPATQAGGGPLTVIVARTLEAVEESTSVVTNLLALGLPVLVLLVAVTTWKVVGRALAPVDAIRHEVDEISPGELHRRVPMPAATDEIARLAATMNRMLERLEQAQERQRRFISDASHELRSPVATIRQHAEVAVAHPERTTVAALAETVLSEDLRVQRLVEDLLLLTRADEHTLELHRRPVDLDDVVFDEARRLRETSPLRIETSDVSAGRVEADVASLRRVVRNLADNAVRHARSQVAFSLTERNGSVVLDVDDDGPSIPAEDRERVFERFVRLDEARARDAGGAGLGLAIVSELISAHRGSVVITDGPLGGARVEVVLPRAAGGDGAS
jgi:signal transduction histidine kinase